MCVCVGGGLSKDLRDGFGSSVVSGRVSVKMSFLRRGSMEEKLRYAK